MLFDEYPEHRLIYRQIGANVATFSLHGANFWHRGHPKENLHPDFLSYDADEIPEFIATAI